MDTTDTSSAEWNRLQRQVSHLRVGLIIVALLFVALAACAWIAWSSTMRAHHATGTEAAAVMRTHGIVVVDAQGHDRILIGAPVPASKDRTREDDASDGIVFLGKTGDDRLAVGQLPALRIGGKTYKRRGDGDNYGMTLYDPKGSERGGLASMGEGRVGLALDRATPPYEGIGLMIDDADNFAGMYINYGDPKARDSAIELGTDADNVSIALKDKDGHPRAKLSLDGANKPAWRFDDAESAAKAAQEQTH